MGRVGVCLAEPGSVEVGVLLFGNDGEDQIAVEHVDNLYGLGCCFHLCHDEVHGDDVFQDQTSAHTLRSVFTFDRLRRPGEGATVDDMPVAEAAGQRDEALVLPDLIDEASAEPCAGGARVPSSRREKVEDRGRVLGVLLWAEVGKVAAALGIGAER